MTPASDVSLNIHSFGTCKNGWEDQTSFVAVNGNLFYLPCKQNPTSMPVDNHISEEIKLLKDTLSGKFGARRIILFGSLAYGKPDADSDIDVCVITNLHGKRKIELIREMRRELAVLISSPLDILVYTEQEFMERARLKGSMEHKIQAQGIQIYEQPGISAGMV